MVPSHRPPLSILAACFLLATVAAACGSKAPADKTEPSPTGNTVSLKGGVSLDLPAGKLQSRPVKPRANQIGFSVYRIDGLDVRFAISELKRDTAKTCKQQLLDEDAAGRKARDKDAAQLKNILVYRLERACGLHAACQYVEMANRSARDFRDGKPFLEAAAYSLCVGDSYLVVTAMLTPPGTPMNDTTRKHLESVARSIRAPDGK